MLQTDKTIPIKELVERFIELDKEFHVESWNIMQTLNETIKYLREIVK